MSRVVNALIEINMLAVLNRAYLLYQQNNLSKANELIEYAFNLAGILQETQAANRCRDMRKLISHHSLPSSTSQLTPTPTTSPVKFRGPVTDSNKSLKLDPTASEMSSMRESILFRKLMKDVQQEDISEENSFVGINEFIENIEKYQRRRSIQGGPHQITPHTVEKIYTWMNRHPNVYNGIDSGSTQPSIDLSDLQSVSMSSPRKARFQSLNTNNFPEWTAKRLRRPGSNPTSPIQSSEPIHPSPLRRASLPC